MAATAIPFSARNVTPADCLLDMLETTTTLRDFCVWTRDFCNSSHLLSFRDLQNLARLGITHRGKLCREKV